MDGTHDNLSFKSSTVFLSISYGQYGNCNNCCSTCAMTYTAVAVIWNQESAPGFLQFDSFLQVYILKLWLPNK